MDEDVFTAFYSETYRDLWAYVLRSTEDRFVADEITQESFVRFHLSSNRGTIPRNSRAYVFSIASNLIRDRWRESRRFERWPEEELAAQSDAVSEELDLKIDFAVSFKKMSEPQRALLWLAYVERYDHSEIATMLNLKKESVRVLLFRARQKLRALLLAQKVNEEVTK